MKTSWPLLAFGYLFTLVNLRLSVVDCNCLSYPIDRDDAEGTTQVKIKLRVYYVEKFDEVEATIAVRASLVVMWRDPCAWEYASQLYPRWNIDKSRNKTRSLDRNLIWTPLITLENGLDKLIAADGASDFPVEVYPDNRVEIWIRKVWRGKCFDLHLANYPFDVNECSLTFGLWATEGAANLSEAELDFSSINFRHLHNQLFTYAFNEPRFTIKPYQCFSGTCYSAEVDYPIVITRNWYPYFFYPLFYPFFTLTILQLSAFIIPYNRVERSGYSVTLFVAFAVTRTETQKYIPQTSESVAVVSASNFSLLASMSATLYFILIYHFKVERVFTKKICKKIDRRTFFLFALFYLILYINTIGNILLPGEQPMSH